MTRFLLNNRRRPRATAHENSAASVCRSPGRGALPVGLAILLCIPASVAAQVPELQGQAEQLEGEDVLNAIERGREFLAGRQDADGSWSVGGAGARYHVGVSALALLALLNSGMTLEDPAVQRGLEYLRSVREPQPQKTYEIAVMIMALAAADDGERDKTRILTLARKLEEFQYKQGPHAGAWTYGDPSGGLRLFSYDRSNSQFAILGLREAAQAGIEVDRDVWKRARQHWLNHQNPDGGWSYTTRHPSTGSMTAAGIATLGITERMLREDNLGPDGQPDCCPMYEPDEALQRGINWMANHFAVGHNPGERGNWLLYYLYGLERAGRLSGRRFFGNNDWYRKGARFLVNGQSRRTGAWSGSGAMERDPVVGTSFALLFLSKGLSPVVINKLKYGPEDPVRPGRILGENWNRHRNDVRNLVDHLSGRPNWPRLLTWQTVDLRQVDEHGGVADLMQAPILYISGKDAPEFTPEQIKLLREYINQGGFLFAAATCHGDGFDTGFRQLVQDMFPEEPIALRKLPPEHPVFRAEHPLDPDSVPLWGADFGCRTAIVYWPHDAALDLSCLWEYWARHDPPGRPADFKSMVTKATRIGVNVIAYATGREIDNKLDQPGLIDQEEPRERIQRGLLQIAKIRHDGAWDAAPQALRNLLLALNRTVGLAVSTEEKNLPAGDPDIARYPMLYMHGRNRFRLSRQGREQLKTYLARGGVLFADACCGATAFDESFRDLVARMFPEKQLERIPPDHDLFTTSVGHDIRQVKRRTLAVDDPNAPLQTVVRQGEPFLEGLKIGDRYAIIYSKYDISCALQRQASVACEGYLPEDAVRIGVNVVLYAMLQNASYAEAME